MYPPIIHPTIYSANIFECLLYARPLVIGAEDTINRHESFYIWMLCSEES